MFRISSLLGSEADPLERLAYFGRGFDQLNQDAFPADRRRLVALGCELWPLFSPMIGALGAFIAGSNTLSNMMFSLFQFATAQDIGLGLKGAAVVMALQAVGGAAGNMICVHNVVAASAMVGLVGREGDLIRKALVPMTYYVLAVGMLGMAIIVAGINLWYLAWLVVVASFITFMIFSRGKPRAPAGSTGLPGREIVDK